MNPIPLLLISDAPSAGTGLARITRDLATRIHNGLSDRFRVATLGYGGVGTHDLGFMQYHIPEMKDWVLPCLENVWKDFAGRQPGIIMTIWDASRLVWLTWPQFCPDKQLANWLLKTPIEKWSYMPIDSSGPNDKLTMALRETISRFDRVITYSGWAAGVLTQTIGQDCDFLPHGIDTTVFYPRDRQKARENFIKLVRPCMGDKLDVPADSPLIGIVATNQPRKDYGLMFRALAELPKEMNFRLWVHTDRLEHAWSIPGLMYDYGLILNTIVSTSDISDEDMAQAYSACDLTLAPGLGEGFGYPIFESLACGCPVFHGNYGGAAEWLLFRSMLIEPESYRLEGPYSCLRPVFSPNSWTRAIEGFITQRNKQPAERESLLPQQLNWENLWPRWRTWLLKGVENWR